MATDYNATLEQREITLRIALHGIVYTQHLWSVSSEGSFACHTFCYSGHLYIMVISEDSLAVAVSLPASTTLGLSRLGFEYPTLRMRGERSNRLRHSGGQNICYQ